MQRLVTLKRVKSHVKINVIIKRPKIEKNAVYFRRCVRMQKNILMELVNGIVKIMANKLVSIVLYGSVARGTNTEESDVDIALIMHGGLDFDTEDRLSDFIVDMNLKYDKVFSVIDIDIEHFQKWIKALPFYQNVEREGIVLWKAA